MLYALNVLTTFLIPMLTVVLVDDACFYNALYQPAPVETSNSVEVCIIYSSILSRSGKCFLWDDFVSTTKTVDPFAYGYTCSDSVMRIYIPLYMEMSILLVAKSASSLIYLCWDAYDDEEAPLDAEPRKLYMLMGLFRKMVPDNHLLCDNSRRKSLYQPGVVFKTVVKQWITKSLPGTFVNILVLLTFGFAAPPLAIMMITHLVIDSCVRQLVFGKFIETEMSVLLEHKRQAVSVVDRDTIAEARKRARMQDAVKDVDEPWGARAALKEVETQCRFVPTSELAHGRLSFIRIISGLLALKLIDVENSSSAEDAMSVWAAITMISSAFALVLFAWIYKKYRIYINRETSRAGGHIQQELKGSVIEMTTAKAQLPSLEHSKEGARTSLQIDASDYGVKEHALEEGATRNPMRNIADIVPTA